MTLEDGGTCELGRTSCSSCPLEGKVRLFEQAMLHVEVSNGLYLHALAAGDRRQRLTAVPLLSTLRAGGWENKDNKHRGSTRPTATPFCRPSTMLRLRTSRHEESGTAASRSSCKGYDRRDHEQLCRSFSSTWIQPYPMPKARWGSQHVRGTKLCFSGLQAFRACLGPRRLVIRFSQAQPR